MRANTKAERIAFAIRDIARERAAADDTANSWTFKFVSVADVAARNKTTPGDIINALTNARAAVVAYLPYGWSARHNTLSTDVLTVTRVVW